MSDNEAGLTDFLNYLAELSISNSDETIFYQGMPTSMQMLMYILLMRRYNNQCFLYLSEPKKKGVIQDIYSFVTFTSDKDIHGLASQIIKCIDNGIHTIIIPYELNTSKGRHANMLIYKVIGHIHQIDHFEPHGKHISISESEAINIQYEELVERLQDIIAAYFLQKKENIEPIYNKPEDLCPVNLGLQQQHENWMKRPTVKSGIIKSKANYGLCGYWSIFIAELVLKFPDIETSFILNKVFELYSNTKSPNLNDLIKGYIFYNNDALNELYKEFSKECSEELDDSQNELILYKNLKKYIRTQYLAPMSRSGTVKGGKKKKYSRRKRCTCKR